jgi:hypothetical protein
MALHETLWVAKQILTKLLCSNPLRLWRLDFPRIEQRLGRRDCNQKGEANSIGWLSNGAIPVVVQAYPR